MRTVLAAVALAFALLSPGAALARTVIAVLPPDLPGDRTPILSAFGQALSTFSASDRLIVLVPGKGQIASVQFPDGPQAANPAWVKRRLAEQFAPVLRHLNDLAVVPAPGNTGQNLMIPDALAEIGRNILSGLPGRKAEILLLGSWLYFDPKDGRWAMTERYYPSDGHLRARLTETPFGVAGLSQLLAGATVHFCWPQGQDEFATKAHEEAVRRFWSLWTTSQGGRIGTFSFDAAICLRRSFAGDASGQSSYEPARDSKIEMLRARPPQPATLPASLAQPGEYFLRDDVPISRTPPTTTTGIAWVGLKWGAPCDIDLYARAQGTSSWLFFGNARTEEGRFDKDFLTGTGARQFEFIEFARPIDLAKAEVAINLYEGDLPAPPEGVIRVWFGGHVYEAPFKLAAPRGNRGAQPMTGSHWLRIDLRKVVGLP